MLHKLLNSISNVHQGFIALIVGCVLVFGALGKLGFLQAFLNIIMIVVGIYLLLWGFHQSNLLSKIKNIKK